MKDDDSSHINRDEGAEHLIRVELYGIKANCKPSPANEPTPRTWGEVPGNVNQSLIRCVADLFALVADAVSSTRSIVRGLGNSPAAFNEWIATPQQKATSREDHSHIQLENRKANLQFPPGQSVERLQLPDNSNAQSR